MPDYHEIVAEITRRQSIPACDLLRREYVSKLQQLRNRNIVLYYSAWLQKQQSGCNINDFDMNGFMSVLHGLDRNIGLDLILHTPGGDLAATEALGEYLKKQFSNDICVFVPHIAMSGGTLLSFLAKEIFMGTHSNLGPIDPVINGLAAHGICEEFDQAIKDIKNDPTTIEVWKHIIAKYHPSFIGDCKKAVHWSVEIATRWLSEGMFSSELPEKCNEIVKRIVDEFSDHGVTKSHSRHLMVEKCIELGLKVFRLETDDELQDAVLSVHHACIFALGFSQIVKLIENHNGKTYAISST